MTYFRQRLLAGFAAAGMLLAALPVQTAFAAETTPSGLVEAGIADAVADYAIANPDDYVSFETAVFCRDKLLYTGCFGLSDREQNIPADENTVYEWGSITKTLIWVSVMQLWEQGKIDLEADVRGYLPANFLRHTKYDDPITMLNLMNHNAGWCENVWCIQTMNENAVTSLGDALQATEPAQIYRPGEVSSYCNWGAALAGYVVERISGESFSSYVHKHIFEVLGMGQTAISPAHTDVPWVRQQREKLICYEQTPAGFSSIGQALAYITLYPAGAATGTLADLAAYAQSFVTDDCPLFEKPETRDFLFTASDTLGTTEIPACYHGFWCDTFGSTKTLGHSGGTNGCSSNMVFDRESGYGAVVLMNGGSAPAMKVPELIFGAAAGTEPPAEYVQDITNHEDISGLYIGTRSMRHGPLKILSLISILPLTKQSDDSFSALNVAKIQRIADGTLWLSQGEAGYAAGDRTLPDGTRVIGLGAQSYATDKWAPVCLIALAVYLLFMLIGLLLLLIKLIGRIAKKRHGYYNSAMMTWAQILRAVSVGAVVFLLTRYPNQYGLTKMQGYISCGTQALICLFFLITAWRDLCGMFSKREDKAGGFKYFANFVANGASVFAVIMLELFRFWGI